MDQNIRQTVRRKLVPPHTREQARIGLAWAALHKPADVIDAYDLAMSRILYTDEELAAGKRFHSQVCAPHPAPHPSAPKRPRGRPRSDAPLSVAERSRRYREDMGALRLPRDVLHALDALAQRHADPSRAACVARLVREAAG